VDENGGRLLSQREVPTYWPSRLSSGISLLPPAQIVDHGGLCLRVPLIEGFQEVDAAEERDAIAALPMGKSLVLSVTRVPGTPAARAVRIIARSSGSKSHDRSASGATR